MATNTGFPRPVGSAAITKVHSSATETQLDIETLKAIVVFCGIGLIVSLLFATNGLDMSAGFF